MKRRWRNVLMRSRGSCSATSMPRTSRAQSKPRPSSSG